MRRLVSIVFLLLALIPCSTPAQEGAPPKTRLKIGVALEGGGALGLAHVGVLQWFEEHHIPVDYVAGTSMGGLVGGFYATGKSPQELRALVNGLDWDLILGGATPYGDLSYRRKEDRRAYPNSIVLGLRHGLTAPAGLNGGHQISLLIDRETLPYSKVRSFDALPVPFRCVAADLVSGKQVVFQEGSLAEALRASISIPAVFTPVRDGGRVYVDGGLLNNLPTDVVRAMGADIVIAVHLETEPVKAEEIHSLFSVLSASVSVVVLQSELRGMAGADLVVPVRLSGFTLTDYKKSEAMIQRGVEAAAGKSRLLEKFALDDAAWREFQQQRDARRLTAVPAPQFVSVTGAEQLAASRIEQFLSRFLGKPLNTQELESALTQLSGVGRFERVGYRLAQKDGRDGLLVTVQEKTYAPPTIQPAFQVDGSDNTNVEFTLGTRLTFLDVAGFRSEWRTDLLFGSTYGIQSELYRPWSASSRWFFAPHAEASNRAFHVFRGNTPLADYRLNRVAIGADIGYGFNRFTELRLGYEIGYLNAKLRLGTPQFASVSGLVAGPRLRFLMDRTDDPVIPRRGVQIESNFHWYDTHADASEAFPALDLRTGYFQPIARRASVFVYGEGGSTFGRQHTGLPQFFLGGPQRLSAYGLNELSGDQYFYGRAGYLRDLFTLPPFVGKKIYAVGAFEMAKMYGAANGSRLPNDFAAGVIAETSLGPLFLGGSVGDTGHKKWFFQLGRVF